MDEAEDVQQLFRSTARQVAMSRQHPGAAGTVIKPKGGWWNSKGVGGPDKWHYIERKRMGGGMWWTRCAEHFTRNEPNTLRPEPPDQENVCQWCEDAL